MNTTGTGSISTNDVDGTIARATSKVHDTVDRVAASVVPVVDRARSAAEDAGHRIQSTASELIDTRDQWMDDLRTVVKERPLTTIVVTGLVALFVGRFWMR